MNLLSQDKNHLKHSNSINENVNFNKMNELSENQDDEQDSFSLTKNIDRTNAGNYSSLSG